MRHYRITFLGTGGRGDTGRQARVDVSAVNPLRRSEGIDGE